MSSTGVDEGNGSTPVLLQMQGVSKSFDGVVALKDAALSVARGEVHGLLGGNGAGKTTLMNVLYGMYKADEGRISLHGKEIQVSSPGEAIRHGIGMVHQHFLQVLSYTAAENIVLGVKPAVSATKAEPRIAELAERFGLSVNPRARVAELSVGARQRLEILKVLYRGAQLLVLDEPTTNLTPQEVEALFSSLRKIVDEGISVIFISHKIREVLAVCDRMTIMRNGVDVACVRRSEVDAESLATLVTGEVPNSEQIAILVGVTSSKDLNTIRESDIELAILDIPKNEDSFIATDLCVENDYGVEAIHGISLKCEAGRILGISGVAGNGQSELVEALTGVRETKSGTLILGDIDLTGQRRDRWIRAGVAYVPEDRYRDGILGSASVLDNLLIGAQRTKRFGNGRWIKWSKVREHAKEMITKYSIKTPSASTPAGMLSGGNIQRVILARAFSQNPKLLVLHNPTRGLDLESTRMVYGQVRGAMAAGTCVLLISEDLDEMMYLADRIAVLYSGNLIGERIRGEYDEFDLGRMMTGLEVSR